MCFWSGLQYKIEQLYIGQKYGLLFLYTIFINHKGNKVIHHSHFSHSFGARNAIVRHALITFIQLDLIVVLNQDLKFSIVCVT